MPPLPIRFDGRVDPNVRSIISRYSDGKVASSMAEQRQEKEAENWRKAEIAAKE